MHRDDAFKQNAEYSHRRAYVVADGDRIGCGEIGRARWAVDAVDEENGHEEESEIDEIVNGHDKHVFVACVFKFGVEENARVDEICEHAERSDHGSNVIGNGETGESHICWDCSSCCYV